MNPFSQSRLPGRLLLALPAVLLAPAANAQTPDAPQVLETFVTTGTRTPAAPQTLGSAVDTLTANELARRQIDSLAEALGGVPGAPLFASGAPGASASLFLRGANSNQTLFLVDGLRMNDPNTDYAVLLGGATLAPGDRIEVVRGPQSTLYGSDAVGGVVALTTGKGAGAPSAQVSAEAGSFGTVRGGVAAQGASGPAAYNVSVQAGHTDNARANNAFDGATTALRLDRTLSEHAAMGATLRWFHGDYGDPGDRFTDDPNNTVREDNVLGTLFADVKWGGAWQAHVILGGQDRRFVSDNPAPNPPYFSPAQTTVVKNRRAVLDAQTSFTGWDRHRVTGGATLEANHTVNTGFGDIDRRQSLWAVFAQDEFSPVDEVYLTTGLRHDDFDTFGGATTGRATVAWLVAGRTLKLRASYGTGFRAPGFLDLYGQSAYYVGNPDLKPEEARGGDVGVDYYLPGQRGVLSATAFQTDYRNLIVYDFTVYPSTVVNAGKARTRGIELSATVSWAGAIDARVGYTYLDAQNRVDGSRLLRRPRHGLNAEVSHDFGRGFTAGAGVAFAAQREDVDAASYLTIDAEDYTVARIFVTWQVSAALAVKARVENLLNEKYEAVNGYPARGAGAFGGVEWRF
ncbi:TonB-dependent receptor [Horticoccus luteus]|uniref:TonB-dependent receptor n=1 Tax=Horticoccus luteus TaxID=2862869 RepID=A0A8F9TUV0_9BACT|nr:TonB-dependent receptor [Horticoccus luteus]QYM79485.1 TonB-dependent receptor [Horticoccus luteus]